MSHYAVAVFTDGNTTIEELLAPYSENLVVPHYISKNELIDGVRWRNEEDGSNLTDEELYNYAIEYEKPENIRDDGSVFSTYNPNSKWDWYQVGGRFYGGVPLKSGTFENDAQMCDVDVDHRDSEEYKRSLRFWQLRVEGQSPETDDDKALMMLCYNKKHYTDRFDSAEEYAEWCCGFSFYAALLPNGEWLEPGKMGWFAISDATAESDRAWRKKVKEILKEAQKKNWHITIVDCHI